MRSTIEIIIAVKEAQPATEEELRLAIVAMSSIHYFIDHDLKGLIEAIREDKPTGFLKAKAEFSWGTIERMFQAQKKPPNEWLGPGDIPGTAENAERLRVGKAIFKKATGLEL